MADTRQNGTMPQTNDTGSAGRDEKERKNLKESEISKLIRAIGMQRILQDLIDELGRYSVGADEDYIIQLKADLEAALKKYKERHEDEE